MNKRVIVSGATSGMGYETAKLLAQRDHQVFAGYRSDTGLQALSVLVRDFGDRVIPLQLDVQNAASVNAAVASVIETAGGIDALVNNAGYGLVASVEDGSDDEFIRQFDVNVFGVLRLTRACIPFMRTARSGVIVNVSSFLGHIGLPLLTHYNASKYAVEGISDSLRLELKPFGIRVHTVAPGLFRTDFVSRGLAANPQTTAEGSPYEDIAVRILPAVARKISEGPHPLGVATAVVRVVEEADSSVRIPVGEEAILAEEWKRTLGSEAFEEKVEAFFGLSA